jgi:hypothetical protein
MSTETSTVLLVFFNEVDPLVCNKILKFLIGDLRYMIITPQPPLPPSALCLNGVNEIVDMKMSMQEEDSTTFLDL